MVADMDTIYALHGAKFEHALHLVNFLPGVDTYEDLGVCYGILQVTRNRAKQDGHPLVVTEVGTYAGRMGAGLSAAFAQCPQDRLYLVDSFEGIKDKDPDSLGGPWKEFQTAEKISGVDLHSHLRMCLYSLGARDNVICLRGSPASLGKNFDRTHRDAKIDFLIFNNLDLPYREYLDVANSWLQWLRLGAPVMFFGLQSEAVSAVVKELLTRKWTLLRQGASGMRSHAVLVRPVDETSGSIGNELIEDEDLKDET